MPFPQELRLVHPAQFEVLRLQRRDEARSLHSRCLETDEHQAQEGQEEEGVLVPPPRCAAAWQQ